MQLGRRTILRSITAATATLASGSTRKLLAAFVPNQATPQATTTSGPVTGYMAPNPGGRVTAVAAFKGIPYGADTRETRFQPPIKPHPWATPRPCTAWAPRAPQQSPDRVANPGPGASIEAGFRAMEGTVVHYHLPPDEGPQSEDCLHLNVWSPNLRASVSATLPVLFYIHGGAYNNGTVNAELYDGTRLAGTGEVVVVTVNHRLNAFGYLYLSDLPGLSDADRLRYRASGNAGMLDLVLALEWVRDNIARFGGDPNRVTIFGQSGGGAKCATLMAMPAAKGLFHRVLTMSGQQVTAPSRRLSTDRAIKAVAAMGILNAKPLAQPGSVTAAQLDALTVEQIQAGARTGNNWLPVRDEVVLLRDPFEPDAPPISNEIPMILGNTKDEIYGSTAWRYAGLTWETLPAELDKAIAQFEGNLSVDDIIRAYRGWYPTYSPVDVFVAALAAFRSWPGQVIEAERRASAPDAAKHTWVYQMDFGVPTADGRAPHTVDIAFIFDNLALSPGVVGGTEADLKAAQPLATAMSQMLICYAKTGDPNGGHSGLPPWPVYDLVARKTMMFDRQCTVVSDPRGAERRMMAGARYVQPGTRE
jgi:para-nitrobenzyl esterase